MEAPGLYWLPLQGVLEGAGFEVRIVNGRRSRNLPARKSDMRAGCDAQVLKTKQRALNRLAKQLGQQLVTIVNPA